MKFEFTTAARQLSHPPSLPAIEQALGSVRADPPRTFPEAPPPAKCAMPAKRILLVEDEPDTQDILAIVLRGHGYAFDAPGQPPRPGDIWRRWRIPRYRGL